jgi:hypothetical protein
MKTTKALRFGNIAVAAIIGCLLALPVQAEIKSHSGSLIIEQPADLPEQARTPGESVFLYQAGGSETYLYVEQQDGTQLAVFDVTDPAKIKTASSVQLQTHRPFDFVRALNDEAELIRFRDNQQLAVIDLHKAKSPTLKIVNALDEGHTETSGATGFLIVNEPYKGVTAVAHDYQVVDTSNPAGPTPIATIKQVKHTIVDQQTGTTYMLGSDGLTVVRRPRIENDYEIHQIQMEPN